MLDQLDEIADRLACLGACCAGICKRPAAALLGFVALFEQTGKQRGQVIWRQHALLDRVEHDVVEHLAGHRRQRAGIARAVHPMLAGVVMIAPALAGAHGESAIAAAFATSGEFGRQQGDAIDNARRRLARAAFGAPGGGRGEHLGIDDRWARHADPVILGKSLAIVTPLSVEIKPDIMAASQDIRDIAVVELAATKIVAALVQEGGDAADAHRP